MKNPFCRNENALAAKPDAPSRCLKGFSFQGPWPDRFCLIPRMNQIAEHNQTGAKEHFSPVAGPDKSKSRRRAGNDLLFP
jgi:hypothetical protein